MRGDDQQAGVTSSPTWPSPGKGPCGLRNGAPAIHPGTTSDLAFARDDVRIGPGTRVRFRAGCAFYRSKDECALRKSLAGCQGRSPQLAVDRCMSPPLRLPVVSPVSLSFLFNGARAQGEAVAECVRNMSTSFGHVRRGSSVPQSRGMTSTLSGQPSTLRRPGPGLF